MVADPITTKKCPHCAEEIQKAAKLCKHCGKKIGGVSIVAVLCGICVLGLGGCAALIIGTGSILNSAVSDATKTAALPASESQGVAEKHFRIGQSVTIDGLEYKFSKPSIKKKIGSNSFASKTAEKGASFVIVNYSVLNHGNKTATVLSDNFRLKTPSGTEYSPESEAISALAMSGDKADLILSELQPGIRKASMTAFEVPDHATKSDLFLHVPSSELFSGAGVDVDMQ